MFISQEKIHELLNRRSELNARLGFLPYDGTPEIKIINGDKYLYVRKREDGKLKSTYVNKYSDELYNLLLKNAKEAKELRKEIKAIDKELKLLNYLKKDISREVIDNINFAKTNIKNIIYDQSVLEGVDATFPQTEQIIENGKVFGVSTTDVLKIVNLKHAWEFILDEDVITSETNFSLLSYIAKLVNEGFFIDGGKIRTVPVSIGGSSYSPPLPNQIDVKEDIQKIIEEKGEVIDKAIKLCLYVMKTQIFLDGNKRAGVIFANHYLISEGEGLLVIPQDKVEEFKKLLARYYEGEDFSFISSFMKNFCYRKITSTKY